MQAYRIGDGGGDPALEEVARPAPGPGEVLVRIAACGLNFADLLMISGTYQDRPDPPFTLGMEPAGTVVAQGAGVTSPALGARVVVFSGHGGLADYGSFPARRCLVLPDAMPFDHAAAFQVAYGTAHLALSHRARLTPGEVLAVFGAGGGVGLAAVEVGARMGARVIAVARGADKAAAARAAGAHVVLDGADDDIAGRLRALGGADVVFDPVGGTAFEAGLRAARPEARILTIGFAGGGVPRPAANILLVKNVTVIGVYWGGYLSFRPDALADSLNALLRWYAGGSLRPHVGHRLPLARVAEALDLLRQRRAVGKVVVTMPGADRWRGELPTAIV